MVEYLGSKDIEEVKDLPIVDKRNREFITSRDFSGIDLPTLLKEFDNPVEKQKELASQMYAYISQKMEIEFKENGHISDSTRRFMELYNDLLDKLHKNLYGEKTTALHLHKITHADISRKIREFSTVSVIDAEVTKKEENP